MIVYLRVIVTGKCESHVQTRCTASVTHLTVSGLHCWRRFASSSLCRKVVWRASLFAICELIWWLLASPPHCLGKALTMLYQQQMCLSWSGKQYCPINATLLKENRGCWLLDPRTEATESESWKHRAYKHIPSS